MKINTRKKNLEYRQDVAFINRGNELHDLRNFVDKRPAEILFLHGPKSSGKTTLLYNFFDQIQKEQKMDVKFLNLRERSISNYKNFLGILFGVDYSRTKKDVKEIMEKGELDPLVIMKKEFLKKRRQGIKSIFIIDELQAIDHLYMNNGKERRVIIELFNFFAAMTKESHLAHVIIASSDGYFLNTIFNDSKLKKCSRFYKVNYLIKEDVMEWLLNLEKYSKIKDYTLTETDAEKIWDTVAGSMWEIQDILTELFDNPIDEVLSLYKKKIKGMMEYYIGADLQKEKVLRLFMEKETARLRDFITAGIDPGEIAHLLQDMVRNNILYFDPTEALYYPQGRSYHWGIKLYFESIS